MPAEWESFVKEVQEMSWPFGYSFLICNDKIASMPGQRNPGILVGIEAFVYSARQASRQIGGISFGGPVQHIAIHACRIDPFI